MKQSDLLKIVSTPYPLRSTSPQLIEMKNSKTVFANFPHNSPLANLIYLENEHYLIAQLLFLWALRISEVLRITWADCKPNGFIIIKGSKKSYDRLIYYPNLVLLRGDSAYIDSDPVFRVTYKQIYYQMRRLGISIKLYKWSKHCTVTHLGRHYQIAEWRKMVSDDIQILQNHTGHKSKAGLSFYLKPLPYTDSQK